MTTIQLFKGLSAAALSVSLLACGGSDNPQPSITLVKAYENPSCLAPPVVTSSTLTKELVDAGVEVRARQCGSNPDITTGASCANPVTGYNVVDIPQDQKARAQSVGYVDLSNFPSLIVSACPA
jgi:hypothetical protein